MRLKELTLNLFIIFITLLIFLVLAELVTKTFWNEDYTHGPKIWFEK